MSSSLRKIEKRRKGVYRDFYLEDLSCNGLRRRKLEIPKAKPKGFAFSFCDGGMYS